MTRLKRVAPIKVPQHIIQRGDNRQACFCDEHDMKACLSWLMEFSVKHQVGVHAWVLMTNYVYLLCTPRQEIRISKMMQSLGRVYVFWSSRIGHFQLEVFIHLLSMCAPMLFNISLMLAARFWLSIKSRF
jgi:REP element-mobilizing transposase RayT